MRGKKFFVRTLLVVLGVFLTFNSVSASWTCCSVEKEANGGSSIGGAWNVDNYVCAQSFTPEENYTLCKVSVMLDDNGGAGDATITLYIQDDDSNSPGTIYTMAALPSLGKVWGFWYRFDVPDITLSAGTTYYIRVASTIHTSPTSILWNHEGYNSYPNGQAYLDGGSIDDDYKFITYTYGDCPEVKWSQPPVPYPDEPLEPVNKWTQSPDIDQTGIDVSATKPNLLADDFLCTTTGDITEIWIWGSWKNDRLPFDDHLNVKFTLSIHDDIPAGATHSMPGDVLWYKTFQPGEFAGWADITGIQEGWLYPPGNYIFPGDTICYIYQFFLDSSDTFHQQGTIDNPIVYWLDVQADPCDDLAEFGWKTTHISEQWMDDAVYGVGSEPFNGPWNELRYPFGHQHQYEGQSIDLAFSIKTQPDQIDPCDLYVGWDEKADDWPQYPNDAQMVADDFLCDSNAPVTAIRWWGSFLGWYDNVPPSASELPIGFYLTIWTNVPDLDQWDPDVYSHPNYIIWDNFCDSYTVEYYGKEYDPRKGIVDLPKFEFYQPIDPCDYWYQPDDQQIYWLGISAIYGDRANDPCYPWGWETREHFFMDDAVRLFSWPNPSLTYEMSDFEPIKYNDETWDLSFELITHEEEPCEPNYAKPLVPHTKWSQPPIEMMMMYVDGTREPPPVYCGWDEPSHLIGPGFWNIVADDFRCLGTMPVTSVHWWGSYVGWEYEQPPLPGPIAWRIGFWSNVPDPDPCDPLTFSYPKELLWQIEVPAERVDVNLVGTDYFPDMQFSDTCFQYYVDLEPNEVFWQGEFEPSTTDNIFWLSIVAVYGESHNYEWGWKTRPWHWMDDAVAFWLEGPFEPGIVVNPEWTEMYPLEGPDGSYDVAFELDTDPNYIKWEQLYTGIRDWPHYEDEESMGFVERWTEVETKWLQAPDLTPNGIDVDATMELTPYPMWPPQILADDFNCIETGPITDIHIWGSWFYDEMPYGEPMAVDFTLCIYSDNPNGTMGWSEPNELLWRMDFPAGAFMVEGPFDGLEGYFNPCSMPPEYYPENHWNAWKYNFYIDPCEAFIQEGDPCEPVIYWLAVQARPIPMEEPSQWLRFGWKTSIEQWNDDAVWTIGEWGEPYQQWEELRHPETGKSLDLAFEITTEKEHEEFYLDSLVADDWLCERRTPVTAVVWWGSYIGYQYLACEGRLVSPPAKPDYFLLNIWTDVPADPCIPGSYSHPNEVIWEYKAYDYDEVLVGYDKYPEDEPPMRTEPVFRYSVRLPEEEWFRQPDVNSVYWLSIVAVYVDQYPEYWWGWTNHEHVFNDDAVVGWPEYEGPNEWYWEELYDQTGESEDMSFMLFTDPNECSTCANYNCDALVNFLDFADFADDWRWVGPAGGYNNSDLDCNGAVDFKDLRIFCMQWLDSCP